MKKVVIAGGSGFLGQALTKFFLKENIHVVILSRKNKQSLTGETYVKWDAKNLSDWCEHLNGSDTLINLVGRSVDCRYTKKNRELILNSRIDSTTVLGKALNLINHHPKVWLNASTATIYKDLRGDKPPHDEESMGNAVGFSEDVGRAWEKAFFTSGPENIRKVAMRISFVLGKEDGAFPVLKKFTQLGLGGAQGPGSQWMSWLHIDDWIGIVCFLIKNNSISGPVNVTSPNPVRNAEFMKEMRKIFAPFNFGLPAPSFAVHAGAFFLGTAPELVLKSRKVVSKVLKDNGYKFLFTDLASALNNLSAKNK